MAHEIQKRDIQTGIKQAWHGLTNVVEKITRENAGILYPMVIVPAQYAWPSDDGVLGHRAANGRQIVACDDGLPVGAVVGDRYKLIENSAIFDAVLNGISGTEHQIVSCGTVKDRTQAFISLKVAETFQIGHRDIAPLLNITWAHGGLESILLRDSSVTIVCFNTLRMALRESVKNTLKIRHTANANVALLTEGIDNHIGVAAEFKSALESLNSIACSTTEARALYRGHLLAASSSPNSQNVQTHVKGVVDELVATYRFGAGNRGETLLDVLNGFTDYYTKHSVGGTRGGNVQKQIASSEFGASARTKSAFFAALNSHDNRQKLIAIGSVA